ncbi:MAG: F-type H+-transporting ATPase subunit a [Parcubacteria group bacterium Greene0714_21]|nr:MAG: F-type H+-transporting ATPase subunit a [Parcubacteria group bacterium Greene0416_39]TSC97533.1 MAG: F-type H+-transporting ATPase subunit a [Parcubacteria group bacterium Greene1014_47]TSD04409.1 MAG: F-type H+-transporting ATPase subunit a [Parcubacteria group bacterium Greene0714_21]
MEISLKPEIITSFLGIPISNSLILSLISAFLLVAGGFVAVRSLQIVPRKVQNGAEMILESLLSFMAGALGSVERAKTFFPLVASIFLFILFNNWLGVLPGTGSLGVTELHQGKEVFVPFFRSANSDLNTTLALALISVLAIQFYGIRKLGFFSHLSKFFAFHKGPLQAFVGLLELIGEFAKVLSFSFRLFGNIFAGEVLLLIVMMLVPLLAPFPFILLEFFVGFIQALVFAMLTLIFLKVATETVEH